MAIQPSQRRDGVYKNVVYALKLRTNSEYRYVGQSSREVASRFYLHLWESVQGSQLPVHRWVRKHILNVECVVLEQVDVLDNLNFREQVWIAALRESGNRLLNVSDGGGGTPGRIISDQQREEHALKMVGSGNPMFGRKFTEEHRKNISKGLLGRSSWSKGKTFSSEHRQAISDNHHDVKGSNNPFWGKDHNDETRVKMAQASHQTHHVDKDVVNYLCMPCLLIEELSRGSIIEWAEIKSLTPRQTINELRSRHNRTHQKPRENCYLCVRGEIR